MKHETVERVLRGLGRVEAPAGLEGLVLRRLAQGKEARAWGWSVVAAGVVLVCVVALHFEHASVRSTADDFRRTEVEHTSRAEASFVGAEERPKAKALGYLEARAKTVLDAERPKAKALGYLEAKARATPDAERSKAEASRCLSATAKPEVLESFPAPAEPLTEQERLLRMIALARSEPAFELLNEEKREAAMVAGDAEFEAFVRLAHAGGQATGRAAGN